MNLGYGTVAEIMRIYGVTRGYVYKVASVYRWHRYRHPDGGVRYRWDDVDDTLGRATRQDRGDEGKVRG